MNAPDRSDSAPKPQAPVPSPRSPSGFAGRVEAAARRQPPPPPGRGWAIGLLAGAVVIAAIWQFATGGGTAQQIRDNHRPTPLAPEGPGEAVELPPEDAPPPASTPGAPLPPGLSAATASTLELATADLGEGLLLARRALQTLARLPGDVPPEEKNAVRAYVVDRLHAQIASRRLRREAIEAALTLRSTTGPEDLDALTEAVRTDGLEEDDTAAAAIAYLAAIHGADTDASHALIVIVQDERRGLAVRLLAAHALRAIDAVPDDARWTAWAETADPVLRHALTVR